MKSEQATLPCSSVSVSPSAANLSASQAVPRSSGPDLYLNTREPRSQVSCRSLLSSPPREPSLVRRGAGLDLDQIATPLATSRDWKVARRGTVLQATLASGAQWLQIRVLSTLRCLPASWLQESLRPRESQARAGFLLQGPGEPPPRGTCAQHQGQRLCGAFSVNRITDRLQQLNPVVKNTSQRCCSG